MTVAVSIEAGNATPHVLLSRFTAISCTFSLLDCSTASAPTYCQFPLSAVWLLTSSLLIWIESSVAIIDDPLEPVCARLLNYGWIPFRTSSARYTAAIPARNPSFISGGVLLQSRSKFCGGSSQV